ncbi:MAG: SH3 domain-containing protein [Acetatifactor sp.]|nr:SH3 domain-containing protein [Acetatifactor sp.]
MKIWRKLIVMIAFAFALVIFADGLKTVSKAESGTTNNAVNMRKTPSKNGDLVKKLEKGTTVELGNLVDGKDGDGKKWYEVTVGGSSGYIRSDLISKGSTTTVSDGSEVQTGAEEDVTPVSATVAGSNTVRVRTSASTTTSNNILCTINKGTEVTVIAKTIGSDKKTWYKVKLTVEGRDATGYIRSDYLVISGEVKPYEVEPITTDPVENDTPAEQDAKPETKPVVTEKRYETKLVNDVWWLQDIEQGQQYKIEDIFSAADKLQEQYEKANKKAKSSKGWMIFFLLVALAACGAVGYLIFRLREVKEEAFIASIENTTPRRTAERPRVDARTQSVSRDRPAISRDGLEPRRKEEGQRPANGQRSTGNRPQGQKPAQQAAQGQRPAQAAQGQRPAQPGQGQRPAQPGQGQRPAQPGQGQRPAQPGQGQRPAQPGQGQRPAQPRQGQRPAQPGQGQRPAQPGQGQRPAGEQPAQRPAAPQQAPANNRPKNFVQDNDDMEFEFLNWDSDE